MWGNAKPAVPILIAIFAAIVVMAITYARSGFVRLLGVGHVFWIPMLFYFALNLPDSADQPWLNRWVLCLLACNSVSLVIDVIDVVRFIRGEREPHYSWKQPNADQRNTS